MTAHLQKHFYSYLAALVVLVGVVLRAAYLRQSHPYIDEYYSMLAVQQVQQQGYPLLPSGLFYAHGLLYTYLIAALSWLPVTLLSESTVQTDMLYRVPNLLVSLAALLTLFGVTKKWFGPRAAVFAVALLAVMPHGIVWGARVRMYTLVFLLTPLLAYLFYRVTEKPHRKRRTVTALVVLLVGVLSHNWIIVLIPPLLVATLVAVWGQYGRQILNWRWWLPGVLATGAIVAVAVRVQSLGLPVTDANADDIDTQRLLDATLGRLNPLAGFEDNLRLWQEFVWDNPFNLLVLVAALLGLGGLAALFVRQRTAHPFFRPMSFLYVLLGSALLEVLFLLQANLKQPRYVAPLLVLAFIITAGWLDVLLSRLFHYERRASGLPHVVTTGVTVLLLVGLGRLSYRQLPQLFFEGLPAVAYETAFQFIRAEAAPEDAVLTPLPVAASLYLKNPTYFIAQRAGHTFVQPNAQGKFTDRWAGAPWLETSQQFKAALQKYPTTWLAIDQFSLDSQFDAVWKQLLRRNAAPVWAEDGVTVFRAEGLQYDLPTAPDVPLNAQLADTLRLTGYSRELSPAGLRLVLFWDVLSSLPGDYTTFVHLRNSAGQTVAQLDAQPLAGDYPTSRWQPGETVIDELLLPLPSDLPPNNYRLLLGMYRWDTLERLPVQNDTSDENALELETFTLTVSGVE